jgi:hypothetical protein
MVLRREYILHYATARPFAQYALKVTLSERELAAFEEWLDEMVEEGELHHFDLFDHAKLKTVGMEDAIRDVTTCSR